MRASLSLTRVNTASKGSQVQQPIAAAGLNTASKGTKVPASLSVTGLNTASNGGANFEVPCL